MITKQIGVPPLSVLRFALTAMLAISATGCAISANKAFKDVQDSVREGLGEDIHWNQSGDPDATVRERIDALLKEPLTAESAITIALLNNWRLQAIYEQLGIARADVLEASLLPNPIIEGNYKNSINDGEDPEAEFVLLQSFLDILTLPLRRTIAKEELEAVKKEVVRQVLSLAAETQAQFYSVQADEQTLELLQQVVEATGASLAASRKIREAGNIPALDLTQEEIMHAQAKMDLAEAELRARKERERLNILMGLWGEQTGVSIPSRLPDVPETEIDGTEIESQAIRANLELRSIEHRLVAAGRDLGLTRATALIPQFEIGAAFKRETDGNQLLGPAAMIPIPLFNQGQPRVTKATAEFRKLNADYYYAAVEIRSAARAAWDHLNLARARALFSRNIELPLSHKALQQMQLEYNAMQVGVFHLLEAKRNEIGAARRYIDNLREYWIGQTEVKFIQLGHVTEFGMQTTALDSVPGSPLH